jgi:hypothetical protein
MIKEAIKYWTGTTAKVAGIILCTTLCCKGLLLKVEETKMIQQMRYQNNLVQKIVNSADKNRDERLSLAEIDEFSRKTNMDRDKIFIDTYQVRNKLYGLNIEDLEKIAYESGSAKKSGGEGAK